jgi:hypothetical protein
MSAPLKKLGRESDLPHKKIGNIELSNGATKVPKGHPVASIATSKSGVIDRMRVTAVTAIAPCVGGLVVWYPDHDDVGHPAPEQQDSDDTENEGRRTRHQ